MPTIKLYLKFLIIVFIIVSCSGDSDNSDNSKKSKNPDQIDNIDLSDKLGLDSGEVKMFTMPTPLQTAAALKIMGVDYDDHLLLKNGNITSDSDIDLSLALGMYMVDLGYTTIYNNNQKSLSYAQDIQSIMDELPISYYVNDEFRKRFKENIDNQDTLCKIILQGYNDANQYISETENEGMGILILTGSYIEGFYLISSADINTKWKNEYDNLFIQQKLFLDNFIMLLNNYTGNEKIKAVVQNLELLKEAFDEVNIYFNSDKEAYEMKRPISQKTKEKMKTIISKIRKDMTVS